MAEKRYYLAYGSNLNMAQMEWRCPDAKPLGIAQISGYRLLFKGSNSGAYLTIEQETDSSVPVAVWAVSAADEARLDRYEGFPQFYYKKEMDITYKGMVSGRKRKVRAFVYIMHEDRPFGIPSRQYMETCREGYDDFGLNRAILKKAVEDSMEELKWKPKN